MKFTLTEGSKILGTAVQNSGRPAAPDLYTSR